MGRREEEGCVWTAFLLLPSFWTQVIVAGGLSVTDAVGACDGLPSSDEQVDSDTHQLQRA